MSVWSSQEQLGQSSSVNFVTNGLKQEIEEGQIN